MIKSPSSGGLQYRQQGDSFLVHRINERMGHLQSRLLRKVLILL